MFFLPENSENTQESQSPWSIGRQGNTHTHRHTYSIDDKHPIYSCSFAVLNHKLRFMRLPNKTHPNTLTLNMTVQGLIKCVCVCGGGNGMGWVEGDNKVKHHSEGDRWQRGLPVEGRQTLLETSLALTSVFLEFTDKKHAGGRHHH